MSEEKKVCEICSGPIRHRKSKRLTGVCSDKCRLERNKRFWESVEGRQWLKDGKHNAMTSKKEQGGVEGLAKEAADRAMEALERRTSICCEEHQKAFQMLFPKFAWAFESAYIEGYAAALACQAELIGAARLVAYEDALSMALTRRKSHNNSLEESLRLRIESVKSEIAKLEGSALGGGE